MPFVSKRASGAALLAAVASAAGAGEDCASFHDALESSTSIAANGGVVTGAAAFVPGVNGAAVALDGATGVRYPPAAYAGAGGSVSLWFRKIAADASGGILQIGTLGQPDSIGLFYVNGSDLVFETRSSAGALTSVGAAPGVLSQADWTHVVATWRDGDAAREMWLFVDGRYAGYGYAAGAFDHAAAPLEIGYTGYWGYGRGTLDELRAFDWPLSDPEAYAEYVWSSNRHRRQPTGKPVSTGPVHVFGRHLYVDGRPFPVRGVGYQPTPIGAYPWAYPVYSDAAILARDVPLLEAMHVNTIRTWSPPPDMTLLDAIHYGPAEPIYALLGFWVPTSGIDYADPVTIAQVEHDFRNFVRRFKHHPAVLGWLIGNEVNLSLGDEALADWYLLANRLAEAAWLEEGAAYHPTILVNAVRDFGNVDNHSDDVSLDCVDIWGHNTYFGWDAHCYFNYYERLSAKPLLFTEFGVDAWDTRANAPYPGTQAAIEVRQWRQIESACAGGTVMAYSDEWWKDMAVDVPGVQDFGGYGTAYHPDGFSNEEWYGVVAVTEDGSGPDRVYPRAAYYALAAEFAYAPGDVDQDKDVDLADGAALQRCFGGDAAGVCGIVFDFVVDDVIDARDWERVAAALNGPDRPPAVD